MRTRKEILEDFHDQQLAKMINLEIEIEMLQGSVLGLIKDADMDRRNKIEAVLAHKKNELSGAEKVFAIVERKIKEAD